MIMAVTIQLKDFATKASPVPADLVYSANSADSFNEVQITIAELIAAYPGLASIGSLTTLANEMIYTTDVDTYAVSAITAFGRSVVALSAAPTAPAASSLAGWDANKNLSANNYIAGFTSTPSAAGTLVLTVASTEYQEITGSTTEIVQLPVPSTLVAGTPYTIINNSSGVVTVNSSGGNLVQTMAAGTQLDLILLINSGTAAASWQSSYIVDSGLAGAVLLTPSGNQIITTGNLSLATGSFFATVGGYASGSAAGGYQGTFQAYSLTAALGSIALISADNSGNYANVLTNLATSAARTWSLPDASGTIALTTTTGGLSPVSVSGTTQALASGNAYIFNNAAATTGTLPASPTIGDLIKIKGRSAAPWIIQANTGQIITLGSGSSTSAGTATSASGTNSIQLMYVATNEWSVDWTLSAGITLA
jgi:hypothetical protein